MKDFRPKKFSAENLSFFFSPIWPKILIISGNFLAANLANLAKCAPPTLAQPQNLKNRLYEKTSNGFQWNFQDIFLTPPSTSQLDFRPQTAIPLALKSCNWFFATSIFHNFFVFHFFFSQSYFLALGGDLAHVWAYLGPVFGPVRGIMSSDFKNFFSIFLFFFTFFARATCRRVDASRFFFKGFTTRVDGRQLKGLRRA